MNPRAWAYSSHSRVSRGFTASALATTGLMLLLAAAMFAHDLAAFRVDDAAGLGGDGCRRVLCGGSLAGHVGWRSPGWADLGPVRAVVTGLLFRPGRG